MHLISTIPGGWNPGDEGVFYIEQEPGDVLFLSAGDTEISTLNEAYRQLKKTGDDLPSLRMANLTYFKQELTVDTYIEEVASKAKVIVLRLLGGKAYYPYLCDALKEMAEEYDVALVLLPGYDQPDVELVNMSNVSMEFHHQLWQYFIAGGIENLKEGLKLVWNTCCDRQFEIEKTKELEDLFLYHPQKGILKEPEKFSTLIIAYRTHYLAGNLEPINYLCQELGKKGETPLVLFALSFRDKDIDQRITRVVGGQIPNVIINTAGFSIRQMGNDEGLSLFDKWNIPVIQAVMASCTRETWSEGVFGLPPTDLAMNIVLPEVDGKIITQAISFKSSKGKDPLTDSEIVNYETHQQGCDWVVEFVLNWRKLQAKKNVDKKVALIVPNYPNKNSRLANGVGLDTPASTVEVLKSLEAKGYTVSTKELSNSEEFIDKVTQYVTNDQESSVGARVAIRLSEPHFIEVYNQLSDSAKSKIEEQWGDYRQSPSFRKGGFDIPGFCEGNVFVSIQPARGYNQDLQATYHSPDLPPTFEYLAFYIWVQQEFDADAIVHIGKHGNLEWLPGKSVTLDVNECFPAAILKPIPHFYPFIINDPGEGTQAKRRNQAVILDHLIPPMTRAESYGDLLQLELLIDEYYEAAPVDPKRTSLIRNKIQKLVESTHLQEDLNTDSGDIDELLGEIDGYLCELKEAQIRGGLHIYGQLPQGEKLIDLIIALHRITNGGVEGITQALAADLELGFDPLDCEYDAPFEKEVVGKHCRTMGSAVERLEELVKEELWQCLGGKQQVLGGERLMVVFEFIRKITLHKLERTQEETANLLKGLNGQFVPSGGSGAPTRGRLDILPTGRNFYSVDTRAVPSPTAWEIGRKSADLLIRKYLQEEGEYPETVGLSVWGTSTMRTGGDDIAQAMALIGVEPEWQGANRRLKDFKIIPIHKLKRPRVDVMLRISGFFRDAFPDIISLFNKVVERVAMQEEPLGQNPIRKRYIKERMEWEERGLPKELAHEKSLYRVFGSKPGAYGAGLQGLIDEKNWKTKDDLAQVYINWSGYAYYGTKNEGRSAHEVFRQRLRSIDVVMQNQDNREHDLLDSDDYYQFQGGLTSAVESQKGGQPLTYFGDHSRPERPRVKTLKEELLKVYRSRVVNPKWMKGMRDHGYKGAFEMAATMDYLFAYDATTGLVEDFMYTGIVEAYLIDQTNRQFIQKHNHWALKDMSERMLEAIQRGMWKEPSTEMVERLKELFLESEKMTEGNS